MGYPAERVASFEELYAAIRALPKGVTGQILQPGVIHTMGRPAARHRFASRRVLAGLSDDDLMERGGSCWFEVEAEIRFLNDRLAVPDISGWRAETQPPGHGTMSPPR